MEEKMKENNEGEKNEIEGEYLLIFLLLDTFN